MADPSIKFVSIQETHLDDRKQIPKQFLDLEHINNIFFCGATENDQGSGILIFIKKTEEILKETVLFEGRLIHVQTKNWVTGEKINFFSFYGKSNVNGEICKFAFN